MTTTVKQDEDLIQFIIDRLNEGYAEYKKNHPDFAKFVEKELEGKPDAGILGDQGRALKKANSELAFLEEEEPKKRTHCSGCGEWLEGFDQCSQCGRVNL